MRILLDTNIIVSGFISGGNPPGHLLDLWFDGAFDVVICEHQAQELRRVLAYERIRERLDPQSVLDFFAKLAAMELLPDAALPKMTASTDADDNLILAAAIAGGAEMIVSGDRRHMLSLGAVEGVPIVTAAQAVRHFDKSIDN